MTLTEALEKLTAHHDALPPTVRDALVVVLGATCGTCRWWGDPVLGNAECRYPGDRRLTPRSYGCRAWKKREGAIDD